MSSARRPLLTATAAGTLLAALWFVPSANATQDEPARGQVTQQAKAATSADTATSADSGTSTGSGAGAADPTGSAGAGTTTRSTEGARLADTGSFDTTPYVAGGTALLIIGAGFVVYSVRRERHGF